MTGESENRRIDRLLVALDAASCDLASLDTAVELAGRLRVELHALFIEDAELLGVADLPLVRQVSATGAAAEALNVASLERAFRALAGQARRRVAQAAIRVGVRHSFRVVRGTLGTEIELAVSDVDLVVVEGAARPVHGHLRLPARGRRAARLAARTVLVLKAGAAIAAPVIAVYDGTPGAGRALAAAAGLAGRTGVSLTVLAVAPTPEKALALEAEARQALAQTGAEIQTRGVVGDKGEDLLAAVEATGDGIVVLGADNPLVEGEDGERLIERCHCPLLLVR